MANKLPPFYTRLRFATAFLATWLMNLNMFGASAKSLCAPGFNCHGCPWATFACPIGALTYGSAMRSLPVFALGSILAVGSVLGRLVCGFLCPFGFFQDLLHRLPGPKITLPKWFRYGKYAALILLVFLLPWVLGFAPSGYLQVSKPTVNKADNGRLDVKVEVTNLGLEPVQGVQLVTAFQAIEDQKEIFKETRDFNDTLVPPGQTVALPNFKIPNHLKTASLFVDSPQSQINQMPRYQLYFCRLCPNGTLTATIPLYFSKSQKSFYVWATGMSLRLAILAVFLILMVLASRPFCRLFCPLGAMYGLTARLALMRMKLDPVKCVQCGKCDQVCPLDLDVRKELGGMECIACGDCKKVCPKSGIKRVFGV